MENVTGNGNSLWPRRLKYLFGFLVGLSIVLYPFVSSHWNAYRQSQLITHYEKTDTKDKAREANLAKIRKAREYNKTLRVPTVPDAFSMRDGVSDPEYEALLDDKDGMMGYVEIPVIKAQVPIYHYTTKSSLRKGAGHLLGSALPVGGKGSHCVVSAHRGLPNAKLFTNLNLVKKGDRFYFHVLGETYAYQVHKVETVLPSEVSSLSAQDGKDLATLVTCTPYGINSHRLLVHGHRIKLDPKKIDRDRAGVPRSDGRYLLMQLLCVLIGIIAAVIIVWVFDRLQRRRHGK